MSLEKEAARDEAECRLRSLRTAKTAGRVGVQPAGGLSADADAATAGAARGTVAAGACGSRLLTLRLARAASHCTAPPEGGAARSVGGAAAGAAVFLTRGGDAGRASKICFSVSKKLGLSS